MPRQELQSLSFKVCYNCKRFYRNANFLCTFYVREIFISKFMYICCCWFQIEKNAPPVAHAGGDLSITLPTNAIYMNGSQSSDDLGIVKYEWIRDGTSLAIGSIVGNTAHEAVLIVSFFSLDFSFTY